MLVLLDLLDGILQFKNLIVYLQRILQRMQTYLLKFLSNCNLGKEYEHFKHDLKVRIAQASFISCLRLLQT